MVVPFFLCLTSCEDKEKVALSNKQRREIEVLRSEVDILEKSIGERSMYDNLPLLLDDAESALDKEKLKISGLEALQQEAKLAREKAEKDFVDYKAKYPVGS